MNKRFKFIYFALIKCELGGQRLDIIKNIIHNNKNGKLYTGLIGLW